MGTKRCCCKPGTCLIGTDDFNRPDSNPPSGSWSVVDGEWEIESDILRSVTPGPIITTKRQPAPVISGARYATLTTVQLIDLPLNGTKEWGIICGFKDEDNFDWIHLIYRGADDSTNPGTLEPIFYRRTGGTDAVYMDHTTNPQNAFGAGFEPFFSVGGDLPSVTVAYCYSKLNWTIGVSDPALESLWVACDGGLDEMPDLPYGTTGFLFGEFDNWAHYQHFESRPDCDSCTCVCAASNSDRLCWPNEMLLTVLAGPGFVYEDDPPCAGDETGLWDIEVFLHRCSNPVANYADYPGTPPVYPLDMDKYIWYSDPFLAFGIYYWFIVNCGTNDGETTLFVAVLVYGEESPYGQSIDSVMAPPGGGRMYFNRVQPGPNVTPPGFAIPHIGPFTCNPIFLNYLAGFATLDVMINLDATSAACEGPLYWHTLTIIDA